MKKYFNFVVSVLVIISIVQAFPADLDDGKIVPIHEEDSSIPWINKKEASIKNTSTESNEYLNSDKPDRIHFYLFTQANVDEAVEIDMSDMETLARSPFDFRNPTYFMINGWKDLRTHLSYSNIMNALFQADKNKNLNYIFVDWRVYSHFENYTISHQLCSPTGKMVAHFIDWMHDNAKMSFKTLTLYGISMGAQVAGFAGKNVQRGKIHSIIGLDPALPLFQYSNPEGRLADTDAEYVETIHTNGGHWGFYEPIGQTAFYPNGGKYQPGCGSDEDGLCSHLRAGYYFAEALSSREKNEFHAVRCDRLEHVEERKCNQYESIIQMGDPMNAQKPKGIYYLETYSQSPFAMGTVFNLEKKQEIKKI